MFDKEKRREKRERREEVKAQLKEQIKPRPTYGQRMAKKGKREKREAEQKAREDVASQHLKGLHAGNPPGEVVQLGAELLYIDGLSDVQFQVQEQLSTKEKCVTRWIVRGRHDKDFLGMAPTNREVNFGGVSVSSLGNDSVTQDVHYWDMVSLLQQIQAP